jgi:hypothetical protein
MSAADHRIRVHSVACPYIVQSLPELRQLSRKQIPPVLMSAPVVLDLVNEVSRPISVRRAKGAKGDDIDK